MKMFLDTNVILDWILDRKHAFAEEATQIVEAASQKKIDVFMSSGSFYTLAFVLNKSLNSESPREILLRILKIISIKEAAHDFYTTACSSDFLDLEDAFQYHIALYKGEMNVFVTGNTKEFKKHASKSLPVVTPTQAIKILEEIK